MTGPPLIDRAILDDLREQIGADGLGAVLRLFIDEAEAYRTTITEAVGQDGDAAARERARRAAHSLKSGAGQIGAAALSAAAAAVEQAAAEGAPALAQAAAALDRCAAETLAALHPLADPR